MNVNIPSLLYIIVLILSIKCGGGGGFLVENWIVRNLILDDTLIFLSFSLFFCFILILWQGTGAAPKSLALILPIIYGLVRCERQFFHIVVEIDELEIRATNFREQITVKSFQRLSIVVVDTSTGTRYLNYQIMLRSLPAREVNYIITEEQFKNIKKTFQRFCQQYKILQINDEAYKDLFGIIVMFLSHLDFLILSFVIVCHFEP
ncbi:hypothetical protein ACJX0J_029541 [Zea mays]